MHFIVFFVYVGKSDWFAMALWQNNGMAIGTPHEWQGLLEDVSNRPRLVEDATEDA